MDHFYNGFKDELIKMAVDPATKAWAASRAITSGVAGGLMAGLTLRMAQRDKPKEQRASAWKGALPATVLSAAIGMGKGIFEKGIENKVLSALTKAR